MSRLGMSRSQLGPDEGGPTILDVNCESHAKSGAGVVCYSPPKISFIPCPSILHVEALNLIFLPCSASRHSSRFHRFAWLNAPFVVPPSLLYAAGFMRDKTLQNIYRPRRDNSERVVAEAVSFKPSQLQLYGSIFERIYGKLVQVFNLTSLYFTAPTFVARLKGSPDWIPSSEHDEYYHP